MVPNSLSRHLPALLFALAGLILAASLLMGPGGRVSVGHANRPLPLTTAIEAPSGTSDSVSVIVQHHGAASEAMLAVRNVGGTVTREFSIIPAFEAEVPAGAVETLAVHTAISAISVNRDVVSTAKPSRADAGCGKRTAARCDADLASVFPAAIGATDVWGDGITGAGVGIAFLDSGLSDGQKGDFGARVIADVSVARGKNDRYGHGSLVASIAAGDGSQSGQRFAGVAPGANVISVKVGNFDGDAGTGDVIAGLEWVLAHRVEFNIRVLNLSLSEGVPSSYLTNPLNAAIEQVWFSGIVVVAAQGNLGSGEYVVDYAPGNDPFVISVGAFSDNGTVTAEDDYLKSWSSRGVTHDGFAKPDVIAPGSKLIGSVGKGSSYLYRDNPDNRVGKHYLRFSGTSASAPVVAGVVALMLEHAPELTPSQVKARLTQSAGTLAGSDSARVDAYAAVYSDVLADANAGIAPSYWIDGSSGTLRAEPVTPDGIRWDGIRWDGIRWDGIRWDGIRWD